MWTRSQQARDSLCFMVVGIVLLARVVWWAIGWAVFAAAVVFTFTEAVAVVSPAGITWNRTLFFIDAGLIVFALVAIKIAYWNKCRLRR